MSRLVRWYDSLSDWPKAFGRSIIAAVIFYLGALMRTWIGEVAKAGEINVLAVHAGVVLILLTLGSFGVRAVDIVREKRERERELKESALASAYSSVDRVVAERLRDLRSDQAVGDRFLDTFVASIESLQLLVEAAYKTFESAYGEYRRGPTRIEFEATFMTKSYIDGEITIPACANREGRTPRSMLLRPKDKRIYEATVTAQVYREDRPHIRVVENTNEGYQELYGGQLNRIKSSIVVPVLSDSNEVLGTLVIHCDEVGFFKRVDEKYWSDVAEVFTKRLALEKAKLDALVELGRVGPPIRVQPRTDWF